MDYPARSLADIRLCPVFLHCPIMQNSWLPHFGSYATVCILGTHREDDNTAVLRRRGEKPYILGGRARNCRVCKMNNLQGNFCQFKKDGVVCPEPLQVRARCRLLEAKAVKRSLVLAGAAAPWFRGKNSNIDRKHQLSGQSDCVLPAISRKQHAVRECRGCAASIRRLRRYSIGWNQHTSAFHQVLVASLGPEHCCARATATTAMRGD